MLSGWTAACRIWMSQKFPVLTTELEENMQNPFLTRYYNTIEYADACVHNVQVSCRSYLQQNSQIYNFEQAQRVSVTVY